MKFLIVLMLNVVFISSSFALKRGIGYGRSGSDNFLNDSDLNEKSDITMFTDEVDYSDGWWAVHHGIKYERADRLTGIFDGAIDESSISMFSGTVGLRLMHQKGFFQPWIGAGISIGSINLEDPSKSSNLPFVGDEVKFSRGTYTEIGADFMMDDSIGLRIGVKHNRITTDRFSTIKDNLELDYTVPYAALVITARGCNPWWFLYLLDIGPKGDC